MIVLPLVLVWVDGKRELLEEEEVVVVVGRANLFSEKRDEVHRDKGHHSH